MSFTLTGMGNNCRATFTGSTVPASFKNGLHSLTVDAAHTYTLKIKTATSCGLWQTGNTAYRSEKLHVSSPHALTMAIS